MPNLPFQKRKIKTWDSHQTGNRREFLQPDKEYLKNNNNKSKIILNNKKKCFPLI